MLSLNGNTPYYTVASLLEDLMKESISPLNKIFFDMSLCELGNGKCDLIDLEKFINNNGEEVDFWSYAKEFLRDQGRRLYVSLLTTKYHDDEASSIFVNIQNVLESSKYSSKNKSNSCVEKSRNFEDTKKRKIDSLVIDNSTIKADNSKQKKLDPLVSKYSKINPNIVKETKVNSSVSK